jgi:multidrug efflux pump subunit AcrB
VNDNLVLMDHCNKHIDKGMPPNDAIVEAGVARFRPILLTSVTTIVGLMPMMMERSMQAEFLQPVVVALASGVFFAFFVTLLMVPSLYGIGLDINAFFGRVKKWIGSKLPGASHREVSSAPID